MSTNIQDLIATLDNVGTTAANEQLIGASRLDLVAALRRNLYRLQTPFERAWDMTLAEPHMYAAVKTGMDLGLWKAWGKAGGESKSIDELVTLCDQECNPNLLRRLMRLMAARNVVAETGPDSFKTTPFSDALKGDNIHNTVACGEINWMPMAMKIPAHLASIHYQDPTDAEDTAYMKMSNNPEHLSFFARCRWWPEIQESFVASMSNITSWKQDWTEYFDTHHLIEDEIIQNSGKDAPIFVDVGGNTGVDVKRFLKMHPECPDGSLILQDVPDVVEIAKRDMDPKIRAVAHDFFTPQPVLNSRIYFLHSILHDWPDNLAHQILCNLRPAFKRGHSRLVVTDVVVPPSGASAMQATHDLCLMGLLSARERTEKDWRALLGGAGFKVLKVWKDTRGIESVIEAELQEEK